MGLFGFLNRKGLSHAEKVERAYQGYIPEMAGKMFPEGVKQVDKIITSLAKLYSIDLDAADAMQYSAILTTYSDSFIRRVLTQSPNDQIIDCLLVCDPDRMEEVLQNIMENAVKYGDGKLIRIDVSDEEYHKLIVISNSGCTLPDAELSHVFDSFWRGSNAGDKAGNGLGLYICRRLMNEMGGDVFAEIRENMFCITVVCRKIG